MWLNETLALDAMKQKRFEVLYLAWNRLEFTRMSFACMKLNMPWNRVSRLIIYDDLSSDGTREFLAEAVQELPVPAVEIRNGGFHSPAATMNDYIALTETEVFLKLDNDICLPPNNWWEPALTTIRAHPEIELFGMEAGMSGDPPRLDHHLRKYELVLREHVGGVGFMRTSAFIRRRPIPATLGDGRTGFTIWQHKQRPSVAWLSPDPMVIQLDKIPEEPWASLTEKYRRKRWNRAWPPYLAAQSDWWSWLPKEAL
jgi:hypothetical protein